MTGLKREHVLWYLSSVVPDRTRRIVLGTMRAVVILGISYVILYPILLMLSTAFMHPRDIYDITVVWIPRNFTLDNFLPVIEVMDYATSFLHSFTLAGLTGVLNVLACSLIGYGLARFNFRGRNLIFALVVVTLIIPPQTIMIPIFLHFRFLEFFGLVELLRGRPGILDSYWPFVLQSLTGMGLKNGLYIIIFRQFFRGMPRSLEEAAIIDGAGFFRVYRQVMLPNAVPAMVTVFLFSFVWQWNDDYFVSLFLESTEVLPISLSTLSAEVASLAGPTNQLDPFYVSMLNNTGSLLLIAPLLLMFVVLQRYFVESVERTGLVG